MDHYREYLVAFGGAASFGRFRPHCSLRCQRGDRVVIRTPDGLEIGSVLCEATPGHAHFLPNTSVGELVRPASRRDEQAASKLQERAQQLFEDGRRLAAEFGLALELLDAEILLDGRQARLHYLGAGPFDARPLMDALSDRYHLLVTLHNLAEPVEAAENGACGAPGCQAGKCSSCSSGKGCGSCATGTSEPAAPKRVAIL